MFLMLIDTPDPRYRREPEPDPEPEREPWSRRHRRARLVLPWVGCVLCFIVAYLVPPFATFVLTVTALMLFFDGALALLPTGDGLWSNRQ
ncbi:MAG TPA: hypothetical protein VHF51_08855 [Solirubrobacteraceae bacterium]|jgi:hypothetical protein|nr:hypothetical protein [Solirubrobacteraceae bacterium]